MTSANVPFEPEPDLLDSQPPKDAGPEPDPTVDSDTPAAPADVDGLLPAWVKVLDDDYADFENEAARIEELFDDPYFAEIEALRQEVRPARSTQANGSIGRAVALGFANVFDPDRVREDTMVIAEKGDGDPDLPETTLDPDNPKATRVVFKRKKRS